MSSLFGTISISLRALLADQAALETTSNNIANANTPGYSRRRAVLEEEAPVFDGTRMVSRGVTLVKIESLRDRVLELRTYDELQRQQSSQAIADNLQGAQLLFGEDTGSIGDSINKFFNSLNQLATDASSSAQRQTVLNAGVNLCTSISNTAVKLDDMQHNLDRSVVQSLSSINRLTSQIAALNAEISGKQKLGQDSGALEDQRGLLIRQLSQQVDVSTIDDSEGLTLTTSNGSPLVVGSRAYTLDPVLDARGMTCVQSQGVDITSSINSGQLGGLIETRDKRIQGLIENLDEFAFAFTTAINTTHVQGFDLNGNPGTDLIAPHGQTGAAASMKMAITDPNLLAASVDGTRGGNDNLTKILAVQKQPLLKGMTPTELYADMVFNIGSQIQDAQSNAEAGDLIVQQLDNQRGAISGVNMDEEAANLIRFQRAFQAAARVIDVINQLTETSVNLGRN